jgi:hypothetical protein
VDFLPASGRPGSAIQPLLNSAVTAKLMRHKDTTVRISTSKELRQESSLGWLYVPAPFCRSYA